MKRNYQGHLLVANPNNPLDILSRSVILLVSHTGPNAVGLRINHPLVNLSLSKIADIMGLNYKGRDPIWQGGNINQNKIHVIHSLDWRGFSTVKITPNLGVTNDLSILMAIGSGIGPKYFKACSGYLFWEHGRLDAQLDPKHDLEDEPHTWEIALATINNVFDDNYSSQWERCIKDSVKYNIAEWF